MLQNEQQIGLTLTYNELRYILTILSQGAQLGLFRGLEREPANKLYNKIYDILEKSKLSDSAECYISKN